MLVLSRRVGEEIVIGDQVWVRIVSISGNRVGVAITAPRSIPIHREEIHRKRLEFDLASELLVEIPTQSKVKELSCH